MRSVSDLVQFLEGGVTPFGGIGIGIAIFLLVVLRLVCPISTRAQLKAPFVLLVLHLVLVLILGVLPDVQEGDTFAPYFDKTVRLTALALLLLSIARSVFLLILNVVLRRKDGSRSLPGIFRDIIQVVFYAIVALIVLRAAGVEPSSLLTTSALLTAVIGLSLQDTLGNLFAGLAIQAQQPFEVGDWIRYDDDDEQIGEVLEINWRATRLLTVDRVEATVPNNLLAKAGIVNYSKPSKLVRRKCVVVAPNDAPPARVHRIMREAVVEVEGVRAHPAPDVQTIAFTERGVEYRVRYFIEDFAEREQIDSRVRDRLWYAMRRGALQIPPPQRRVVMVEHSAAQLEAARNAGIVEIERELKNVPVFEPLSDELLHELAMHTERRLYAPGELVIQQGDYGEELFVVEKGDLEVLIDRHDGMQRVASIRARQFFGEMSLLTGEPRSATVRAESEVTLLVVSKETLQPILEASPELAAEMSAVLAEREVNLRTTTAPGAKKAAAVTARSGELLSRIREFFSI